MGLKLLFFNGAVVLLYTLLAALLGPVVWQELTADGTAVLGLLLAMGNLSFLLCDRALGAVTLYYRRVLRKKIRRFL